MGSRKFTLPAFRLVRTLDLNIDDGEQKKPVRAEFFQDPSKPTHFRYRLWGIEWFKLTTKDYPEAPLMYELLTTSCMPNLGQGEYFEAPNVDAAEKMFYEDFQKEFSRQL